MAKENEKNDDLTINKRTNKAERKLKIFFKNLSEDKKKFISDAVHQLAVLQITLERLSEELEKSDVIEWFEQGNQKLRRENPALKAYNATIKSYTTLFKQLLDLLPNSDAEKAGKSLMDFALQAGVKK